jgi:hypothetical protein
MGFPVPLLSRPLPCNSPVGFLLARSAFAFACSAWRSSSSFSARFYRRFGTAPCFRRPSSCLATPFARPAVLWAPVGSNAPSDRAFRFDVPSNPLDALRYPFGSNARAVDPSGLAVPSNLLWYFRTWVLVDILLRHGLDPRLKPLS